MRTPAHASAPSHPDSLKPWACPSLEGRDFRDTDRDGTERVVIISRSVAQRLFPGRETVDRHLQWTDGVMKFIGISTEPRRIIGVVPDADDENIIPQLAMTVDQPSTQEGWSGRLFVRAQNDPYVPVPAITRTIHHMAETSQWSAATLEDVRAEVLTPDRLNEIVFGGFATLAPLISVVGVSGALAFSVSGRTREFAPPGPGRRPRSILAKVLSEGLVIAGAGVAAGFVVGFALERTIGKYIARCSCPERYL